MARTISQGCQTNRIRLKCPDGLGKPAHFFLQMSNLSSDVLKVIRVLEVIGAAIGRVQTGQIEVATAQTWRLAVALDLATLALIADRETYKLARTRKRKQKLGQYIPQSAVVQGLASPNRGSTRGDEMAECSRRGCGIAKPTKEKPSRESDDGIGAWLTMQ